MTGNVGPSLRFIVVCAVLMAACGGRPSGSVAADGQRERTSPPQSKPSTTSTGSAGVTYTGAITSSRTFEEGLFISPPGGRHPAVSWEQAYATCMDGDSVCHEKYPTHVSLALATATSAGESGPDGSIIPLMKDTLVYVLMQSDVPCLPMGPRRATSPTVQACTTIAFVDAGSGRVIYSVQGTDLR
jgi:hypothetical protein